MVLRTVPYKTPGLHRFPPAYLAQSLFRLHLRLPAVDDGGISGQQAGGVGDGDAGVGVAVVDGHDAHGGLLSREE